MKYDISSHIVTVYHCHGIFFKLHTSIASLFSSAMRNRCTRNYFKYLKVFATFLHYSTIVYQGDPWLFLCQAVQVPTEALWFIPMWSSLWIGLGNARCPMGMYQAAKATFQIWACQIHSTHTNTQMRSAWKTHHVLYFLKAWGSRISNMTFPCDMVDMDMMDNGN